MSDRFQTEIEIGGPVSAEQLKTIAELTSQVGMSCNWESETDVDWIRTHLLEQMEKNEQYLTINDHEVSHEHESPLTDYLIAQGIPWNKRVDAKYEYDAELTWWRPGMEKPETWTHMNSDCTTVLVSTDMLVRWLHAGRDLRWIIDKLEQIPPPMDEAILT